MAQTNSDSKIIGVLLAAGDIAKCSIDPAKRGKQKETAALIVREIENTPSGVPVRVLVLGDLAYDHGEPESFAKCFDPAWGSFKDKMLPVPGNHEYERKLPNGTYNNEKGTGHAQPYFDYFSNNPLVTKQGPKAGYYTLKFPDESNGPWQLIALNPYVGIQKDSAQLKFVREAMQGAGALPCVLAFSHSFRFSSGHHGHAESKDPKAAKVASAQMKPAYEALLAQKASLLVAGHDHHFEQLGRADIDGKASADGLRSFVVGTGGAALYSTDYKNKWPVTEAYDLKDRGILRIELRPDSYAWSFIPVGGAAPGMKILKAVSSDTCNRKN